MLSIFIIVVSVCAFAVYRYRRRRLHKLTEKMPTLPMLPFIGHAYHFTGNTEDIMNKLKEVSLHAVNNGGIVKIWLGHIFYIMAINPVDVEVLSKTCLEKDDGNRFLRTAIGQGSIFAPVSIWRPRRKILTPAFSPRILNNFVNMFTEQSDILRDKLVAKDGATCFNAWPFVSTYTLDSVCATTMGIKLGAQKDENIPFLKSMTKGLRLISKRFYHLWLHPDWLYKFFPDHQKLKKCIQTLHSFTDEVIANKKAEIEANNGNNKQTEVDSVFDINLYSEKTFLDLLIGLSGGAKGYSNVELREELLTLIIAGTDTSAVALGYTLMLLGKYPRVQEKVYQELCDVFGKSDREVVKEDLLKLVYLERVIKESLRLFPPVPVISRKAMEDVKLPSGWTIPAGSGIVFSIWGIHRDPNYWGPNVEHFDPDRFSPERFNLKHACSYMPFSSGPRNCLGYQYAMMSVKTALASVLRSCEVLGEPEPGPIPNIPVQYDIMMKPVDGFKLQISART